LALFLAFAAPAGGAGSVRVVLAGTPFDLELAADPASRALGLSGRRSIPDRGGMLFVFPDSRPRAFWMFHCFVDIGLLFLDASGTVVSVHEMKVEPALRIGETEAGYRTRLPRYPSGKPARYAIEVRGGTLRELRIRAGHQVNLAGVPKAYR
jgi:uncharacterized membrane protein (UPF0127 family)